MSQLGLGTSTEPGLASKLADALLWKLSHPQQHSSSIDEALADFAEAAERGEIEADPKTLDEAKARVA